MTRRCNIEGLAFRPRSKKMKIKLPGEKKSKRNYIQKKITEYDNILWMSRVGIRIVVSDNLVQWSEAAHTSLRKNGRESGSHFMYNWTSFQGLVKVNNILNLCFPKIPLASLGRIY